MDSSEGPRKRGGAIAVVIVIVILVVVVGKSGGLAGLAGDSGCPTSESYSLPKEELKGIGVSMKAERCEDTSGSKAKSYVLATLTVDGGTKTSDGSNVKSLKTTVRLLSRPAPGKPYRLIPLSEKPKDTGVSHSGPSVSYDTERRWNTPHEQSQVRMKLVLKTDKGPPSIAEHTFFLP